MSATVAAADLADFVGAVLTGLDVPEADAATVARCLVAAELEGHASHGVIRLPFYADRLRLGLITPRPRFTVTRTRAAAITLDAGNALGPVAATRAMDVAAEAALEAGLGMCAVRASNHIGALGAYVRQAADAGLIGLALTNTPPALAPPGGRAPYLGTNPVAAAVPTSHHPLVIDLATSQTARGRILSAARTGDLIPPGWALDADGAPTTDPGAALE
ncbi:MAG TPA: Ldh family oxidoreductase, partial [Acidimicrobiales bacterium]|nr:Ldh family oxidoreductase [Acidimicrobiales bacterium]